MEQYKKSGPAPEKKADTKNDTDIAKLHRLEEQVKQQEAQIRTLEQELRRVKSKMDTHATALNKIRNG